MITLNQVTLHRGTKTILDQANITINPGEHVGVVGRNGTGKSTLFALLDKRLHEDEGICQIPSHWRLSQVAQEMPETTMSATNFVIEGDLTLMKARSEVTNAVDSGDGERMGVAYAALYDAGEADAEARAQTLILGLGFQNSELTKPVNSFSGGWRMRLQLARALICPSDLLLLDEPTNHLDLDALVWLESWLSKYTGTMLVISHDRDFLEAVTQVTVHLERGKLTRYGGSYGFFEKQRAEKLSLEQNAYQKQQEKIAHLQKFIARFKAKASKAKQAQSRVKALGRMEMLAPLLVDAEFTFKFDEPKHLPNPMLTLHNGTLGYSESSPILNNVEFSVLAGQRIGILGANGQGKSTLVKTIAKSIAPLSGELTEGRGLRIGYFAQQEMDLLDANANPLEHFIRMVKDVVSRGALSGQSTREQDIKNYLGQFQFGGDKLTQQVGTMSGGEKARLVLSMIVWQQPNLLLLDEPTNHLDLVTREALSIALNEFEGTVLLVSHDRALLREVCDEFWLVHNARVAPFDGDLEDYQRHLIDIAKRIKAPSETLTNSKSKSRKENKPTQSIEKLNQRISILEQERKEIQVSIESNTDYEKLAAYNDQLIEIEKKLSQLEDEWLSLSS
ncbi:ATP-binding cassette domain-containing protein [Ferrovum sp. PN-J185]|uniref:ABC-F family ATP-binding cassette domain-containing protein n=1 Tax=Ferrovum sp. PN-J185 TaxID=1356306 RepID=UPI000792615A|nr:ATP-binding cassette domain-containing protein [Ferrovum sp. PN-J185]KXW56898.1 putative ABC transporter ATP-binding protein YheS [Ferrovum sp. PN-J185]MCC6069233.1 ATP-binding cassette domain-containing protein [Ferrovum sp. PN-J185]MDE1891466.1 ATP-binding cassette domain-containing protein [Betaproteobacteria bacterium]MDE2056869.1 ATP-binding cassette domain-containing protein [Betaproteobacteria bacterium]